MRVYCTDCSASDEASILVFDNAELVRCRNDTILDQGTGRKMMKRFFVFDDPSVLYFISRDVDSRFSPRELLAVNEWIDSKLGFHTMHDHVWHSDVIMGGMFGMKRGVMPNRTMVALIKEYVNISKSPGTYGDDQGFLAQYIWPNVKYSTISHDPDRGRCRRWGAVSCIDFPLGPPNLENYFFVGAPFKAGWADEASPGYSCVVECKPSLPVTHNLTGK